MRRAPSLNKCKHYCCFARHKMATQALLKCYYRTCVDRSECVCVLIRRFFFWLRDFCCWKSSPKGGKSSQGFTTTWLGFTLCVICMQSLVWWIGFPSSLDFYGSFRIVLDRLVFFPPLSLPLLVNIAHYGEFNCPWNLLLLNDTFIQTQKNILPKNIISQHTGFYCKSVVDPSGRNQTIYNSSKYWLLKARCFWNVNQQ